MALNREEEKHHDSRTVNQSQKQNEREDGRKTGYMARGGGERKKDNKRECEIWIMKM